MSRKELRDENLLAELEKANESSNMFLKLKTAFRSLLINKYKVNIEKTSDEKLLEQREKKKTYIYRCPVFASARRLSEADGGTG